MKLRDDAKIAVVCRGGPENGPFSAQAFRTLGQILRQNGHDISAVFAISGAVPTALIGCIGEEEKLCNIWMNLTPEDIVGPHAYWKAGIRSAFKHESLLSNRYLRKLLSRYSDIDRIFSSEAIPMKVSAVDYLTSKMVTFSNKIPEHKECIIEGALGSMGLAPWFDSPVIPNPKKLKLLNDPHPINSVFLVDGAYGGSLFLEDVIRDEACFNTIFLIDIHGLKASEIDINEPNSWIHKLRRTTHLTINSRDMMSMRLLERINEEITLKDMLVKARAHSSSPKDLDEIIKRMDNGRLQLHDKHSANIYLVSNKEHELPFNFADFKQAQIKHLMRAGHDAVIKVTGELGLSRKGINPIEPS